MGMVVPFSRFQVYLVSLDQTKGSEIKKTRPCLIISPNELNYVLKTIIVAPMTSTIRDYPTRVGIHFQHKDGQVALDQIRTVDKSRLVSHLGVLKSPESTRIIEILLALFSR